VLSSSYAKYKQQHQQLVDSEGAVCSMNYLEKVLEKLREWAEKLIEVLLGPEVEPEPELIPIPVNDPQSRRHH
jgi:hypothetical protein